jgi:NADH:ubiquinone oxidoreductase subunit D
MVGYVELDLPFEQTSKWLHRNLCRLWWFEETHSMMEECYEMIPHLSVSDEHKEFARAHFEKYKIEIDE